MSVKVSDLVWKAHLQKVNGPKGCSPYVEKLVLARLADFASDDGCRVFPSRETIAQECELGKDAVTAAIAQLKSRGILRLVRKSSGIHRRTAEYRVDLDVLRGLAFKVVDSGESASISHGAGIPPHDRSMRRNDHGTAIPLHEAPIGRNEPPHRTESEALIGRQFRSQPSYEPSEEPKKVDAIASTEAKPRRGTRLTKDWKPQGEDIFWAMDQLGSTDAIAESLGSFYDYWTAIPGARGLKLDWDATFRNWIRRDAQKNRRRGNSNPFGVNHLGPVGIARKLIAEAENEKTSGPVIDGDLWDLGPVRQ